MTKCMIVRHRVENYEQFREVFEQIAPTMSQYGFKSAWINRLREDPNLVTVAMTIDDFGRAMDFFHSAANQEAIGRAGIVGDVQVELTTVEELDITSMAPTHGAGFERFM